MFKCWSPIVFHLNRHVRWASTDSYNIAVMTLKKDLKHAMISKNDLEKNTIRGLLSAIKNKEIDNKDKDLDEFVLFETYAKLVKQREDSIKDFQENGRVDLMTKEKQEMEIIQKYMDSLPVASRKEVDKNALKYLESLKASEPDLQMKQVFSKVDWSTISTQWKAAPNVIKSSIAAQYKKIF